METLLTMSTQEFSRLEIMQQLKDKRLKQTDASRMLSISIRQVQRLYASFLRDGAKGLISKKRGAPPNNKIPQSINDSALLIISEHYHDFGPTLAMEKLFENHSLRLSKETVRKIMVRGGLWKTKTQRLERPYQPRYRRDCYGELIQIDGSDHHWFEDRADRCTLLVYIDDATSKLLLLRFVTSESTFSYFEATQQYLLEHGKPVAFYSDRHSVFRANKKGALSGDGITQFGRALESLNIDIICANSSQAKGRVERANKTLQDRLVKELRLKGISGMDEANAFMPQFIKDHNQRFAKEPLNSHNAHRELRAEEDLNDIFCWQEQRSLSKNLTLQYDKVLYMLNDSKEARQLANKRVKIHDYHDGSIKIKHNNIELPYTIFDRLRKVDQGQIVNNKRLGAVLSYVKTKQDKRDEKRSTSAPSRLHLGLESTTQIRAPSRFQE